MAFSAVWIFLASFFWISHGQESCDAEVSPRITTVIAGEDGTIMDSNSCNLTNQISQLYNCTQSIWQGLGDGRFLEWKDAFNLTFHFNTEVNASRIEMVYGCSNMLPSIITISTFSPSSFSYNITQDSDNINTSSLHNATILGRGSFARSLQINFGHQPGSRTCLIRFTFYNCLAGSSTTIDNTTNTKERITIGSPMTNDTTAPESSTAAAVTDTPALSIQTLIIIVSAILGFLLLLVVIAVVGLICLVACKRKKNSSQAFPMMRRNTYVATNRRFAEEKTDLSKKHEFCDSARPMSPPDPEYATIAEYRRDVQGATPPSVSNPFYASNNMLSIPGNRVGYKGEMEDPEVDPPSYCDVTEINVPLSRSRSLDRGLVQGCSSLARSLQDVRSTTLREGRFTSSLQQQQQQQQQQQHRGSVRTLTGLNVVNPGPVPPPRPELTYRTNSLPGHHHHQVAAIKQDQHMMRRMTGVTNIRSGLPAAGVPPVQPESYLSPLSLNIQAAGGNVAAFDGPPERREEVSKDEIVNNYLVLSSC